MEYLSVDKILNLMSAAFQQGYALDLIDISGEREKDISEEKKFCYDAAEAAFNRIDAEKLFENAEALDIPRKYPDFYNYLAELVAELEEDIERTPVTDAELSDGVAEEVEEAVLEEQEMSIQEKVLHEITNGHHTGKERDSEKYVEKDAVRQKLTDEYRKMMQETDIGENKPFQPAAFPQNGSIADEADVNSFGNSNVINPDNTNPKWNQVVNKKHQVDDITGSLHSDQVKGIDNLLRSEHQKKDSASNNQQYVQTPGKHKNVAAEIIRALDGSNLTEDTVPLNRMGYPSEKSQKNEAQENAPEDKKYGKDFKQDELWNKYRPDSYEQIGHSAESLPKGTQEPGIDSANITQPLKKLPHDDGYVKPSKQWLNMTYGQGNANYEAFQSQDNPVAASSIEEAAKNGLKASLKKEQKNTHGKSKYEPDSYEQIGHSAESLPKDMPETGIDHISKSLKRTPYDDGYANSNQATNVTHQQGNVNYKPFQSHSLSKNEQKAGNTIAPETESSNSAHNNEYVNSVSQEQHIPPGQKNVSQEKTPYKTGVDKDMPVRHGEGISTASIYASITGQPDAEIAPNVRALDKAAANVDRKYVIDSYAQVGTYSNMPTTSSGSTEYVDVLATGKRSGNLVTSNIEGTIKKYTIRADGTISVGNQIMMVYGNNEDVTIGWKGIAATDQGKAVTPVGTYFDLNKPEFNITVVKGQKETVQNISTISIAPGLRGKAINEKDFLPGGSGDNPNLFVPSHSSIELPSKYYTDDFIDSDNLHRVILTQGVYSCTAAISFNLNELSKSEFFTDERVGYLADSYESLLSSSCQYYDAPKQMEELKNLLQEKGLPTNLNDLNDNIIRQEKQVNSLRDALKEGKIVSSVDMKNRSSIDKEYLKANERLLETKKYERQFLVLEKKLGINAQETAQLNAVLENYYLKGSERTQYQELKKKLKTEKLPTDIGELNILLHKGNMSTKQAELVQEYLLLTQQSRKRIIQDGILKFHPTSKLYEKEHRLYKRSIQMILEKEGLPTQRKNLFKSIENGSLSSEKEKTAADALRLLNLRFAAEAARFSAVASLLALKKVGKAVKRTLVSAKTFMNRHMGSDYTLRGAMILLGVAALPLKAVRIAKRSIRMAKLAGTATINTAKTIKSGVSMTVAGVKTGFRVIPKIPGKTAKAARNGLRWVKVTKNKVRILGFKKSTQKVTRITGRFAIKTAKGIFGVVVKILISIISSIGSFLLPAILVILVVIGIVLSIMAFIKNTGEEVYYDAGDEDTEAVVQEMVDVLTLCHASFRDSLTNQFGGGISTSATGTTSDGISAPQLQKGESSSVSGLYDVTAGTWWNQEFTQEGYLNGYTMAAGTKQRVVQDELKNGSMSVRDNGGLIFIDEKFYAAAFTSYWGNVGDVIKVEFEGSMAIGDQPATNTMYILIVDIKAFKDTHYPEMKEGLYGHQLGGHRDFAEFIGSTGANLNNSALGAPVKATNIGSIIDGTCDLETIGTGGGSLSSNTNADIYYSQVISQDVYRDILDRDNNIYYTFPSEQEVPDGITPVQSPASDTSSEDQTVYGFYNNNQELIAMVLALFDFDINDTTSVKKTLLLTSDTSDEAKASESQSKGVTNKIDNDTWKLITLFDENGLDLESTGYTEGGYDDLKYSALVGLFNASHIVCGTPVYTYHEGPDGTINPVYSGSNIEDIACEWAVSIANNDSHGYNNTGNGWGPEYNCIGLVMTAYTQAGVNLGKCNINKMPDRLLSMGFVDCTDEVNLHTGEGATRGTIFWRLDETGKHGHTEMYLGDGQVVGARNDDDHLPGDGTGNEIAVSGFIDFGWQRAFRLPATTSDEDNETEEDEPERIIGQHNTDGKSYEVPVMETYSNTIVNADGSVSVEYYTDFKRDADGDIVYETHYSPCPGHLKYSAEVITLHFDALLNLNEWWNDNIYSVDDFDKENPNYSSNDKDADNYKAKETTLKRQFQYIKKPDYYKAEPGTCSGSGASSSTGFSPGTMTETQTEVAQKCYAYMTTRMGLTSEQAYGVLVNIKRECDFNYTANEKADDSGGYGLCQWTGGRRNSLIEWCNAHPESGAYNTLEGQLAYLNAEFNGLSSVWTGNGVTGFRQCSTAREAGEYFIRYFERPAEAHMLQRISEMDSDIAVVKSYVGA